MNKILYGLFLSGSLKSFAFEDIYSTLKSVKGQSVFDLEGINRTIVYNCGSKIIDDTKKMRTLMQIRGGNKLENNSPRNNGGYSKSFGSTWSDIEAIFENSDSPKYYKVKWYASTDTYYGEITRFYDQNCEYILPKKEEILDFIEKWNSDI